MKSLGLVVLFAAFCAPSWAGECGIADSPQELGKVGHHLQYVMSRVKNVGGKPFWGVVAWCPTKDGRFKWAYEAYNRSKALADETVRYKFDSCAGECKSPVQFIIRKSTE